MRYTKRETIKMGFLNIVFGILLVFGGFSCLFTPIMTFINVGYLLIILFFVYGIAAIVRSIAAKSYGAMLIFGILSFIAGVTGIVHPVDVTITTDMFLLFVAGVWFVGQGILSVILAFGKKRVTGRFGWLGLIFGILAIVLGAYSFAHPMFAAMTLGVLISLYFIESGFNLIALGSVQKAVENGTDEV